MSEVTKIINSIKRGEANGTDHLLPLVYQELRNLAAARMSQESSQQTLEPTALVHEVYMRLTRGGQDWESRGHFFAAAAEAMRRILIEKARSKQRLKRKSKRRPLDLNLLEVSEIEPSEELIALDDALTQFKKIDPAKAELVRLRFFAGLSIAQAADVMGISRATAARYWTFARAWLFQQIKADQSKEI